MGYLGGEAPRLTGVQPPAKYYWGRTAPAIIATFERFLTDIKTVREPVRWRAIAFICAVSAIGSASTLRPYSQSPNSGAHTLKPTSVRCVRCGAAITRMSGPSFALRTWANHFRVTTNCAPCRVSDASANTLTPWSIWNDRDVNCGLLATRRAWMKDCRAQYLTTTGRG